MWKLVVIRHYKSKNGYDMESENLFKCSSVKEVGEIISNFEKYGIDKYEYIMSTIGKEEEINE